MQNDHNVIACVWVHAALKHQTQFSLWTRQMLTNRYLQTKLLFPYSHWVLYWTKYLRTFLDHYNEIICMLKVFSPLLPSEKQMCRPEPCGLWLAANTLSSSGAPRARTWCWERPCSLDTSKCLTYGDIIYWRLAHILVTRVFTENKTLTRCKQIHYMCFLSYKSVCYSCPFFLFLKVGFLMSLSKINDDKEKKILGIALKINIA